MRWRTFITTILGTSLLISLQVQLAVAEVSGEWQVVLIAQERFGGGSNPKLHLDHDDGLISGKYEGSFGEGDLQGTLTGGNIYITYTLSTEEQPQVQVEYVGTVEGDSMSGTYNLNGRTLGSFTATKK